MGYWDRFLKYMRGGPEAIDGWPHPIPIEDFNEVIARTLGVALSENSLDFVPHVTTAGRPLASDAPDHGSRDAVLGTRPRYRRSPHGIS